MAVAINTTFRGEIRTWVLSLDHCDLQMSVMVVFGGRCLGGGRMAGDGAKGSSVAELVGPVYGPSASYF